MNLKELKNQLLQNPKIKAEFEKNDLAFNISEQIIDARIKSGLTQNELAKKIKTKQPSIARAENGTRLPNITFLNKIAKALNTSLSQLMGFEKPIFEINQTTESSSDTYKVDSPLNFDNFLINKTNIESISTKINNFHQSGVQK